MANPDTYNRIKTAAVALLEIIDRYELDTADQQDVEELRAALTAKPGQPRAEITAQQVSQLIDSGMSQRAAAKQLGCSLDLVQRRLKQG